MGTGLSEFLSAKSSQQVRIPTTALDLPREEYQSHTTWDDLISYRTEALKHWTNVVQLLRVGPQGYSQPDLYPSDSNFGYLRRRLRASRDDIKRAVSMNLQVMHGNPVFQGTRIPIYQIIEELADGTTLAELPDAYPSVTSEQIQCGLDFAASILRIYDEQIPNR